MKFAWISGNALNIFLLHSPFQVESESYSSWNSHQVRAIEHSKDAKYGIKMNNFWKKSYTLMQRISSFDVARFNSRLISCARRFMESQIWSSSEKTRNWTRIGQEMSARFISWINKRTFWNERFESLNED